jgi:hypothetical protein
MKSNGPEVAQRIEEVFKLRLGGAEFQDIRQYASAPEQNWGVSDRQVWRYIAAADTLVKKRFDARADHLLARHLMQRRMLYAHAVGAGDFATALRILDSEAKLEGLFPPTKIAPTNPAGDAPYECHLSEAERLAAIDAIRSRVGLAGAGPVDPGQADPGGSLLGPPPGRDDGRGAEPRPVAGGPSDPRLPEGFTPLFPTGGEEPG